LPMDEKGIPAEPRARLDLVHKIIERVESEGIAREDIVLDPLAMSVGAEGRAGWVTLETIRLIRAEVGVNQTLGVSNISFGIPDRHLLNNAFLAMAIAAGVNCPMVDAAQVRDQVLAADLALGRDRYASRYLKAYRRRQSR
jgi:5-methyltetrahydrofolate--homocysteine methyltransferase